MPVALQPLKFDREQIVEIVTIRKIVIVFCADNVHERENISTIFQSHPLLLESGVRWAHQPPAEHSLG